MVDNTVFEDRYLSNMQTAMTTLPADGTMQGTPQPGMAQDVPQDTEDVLVLIQLALRRKSNTRHYFAYLLAQSPTPEAEELILTVRNDIIENEGLFEQLYFELAGEPPPDVVWTLYEQPASYCEGLRNVHFVLQEQATFYREVLFQMEQRRHINTMTKIITDVYRHIGILNYLHRKAGCTV
jgi:rubrerythrin